MSWVEKRREENCLGWKNDEREYVLGVKNDGREYVRDGNFSAPIATSDLKQVYDRPVYFLSRSPFVNIPEKSFTQGGD